MPYTTASLVRSWGRERVGWPDSADDLRELGPLGG